MERFIEGLFYILQIVANFGIFIRLEFEVVVESQFYDIKNILSII
jgi:hypothetical protein